MDRIVVLKSLISAAVILPMAACSSGTASNRASGEVRPSMNEVPALQNWGPSPCGRPQITLSLDNTSLTGGIQTAGRTTSARRSGRSVLRADSRTPRWDLTSLEVKVFRPAEARIPSGRPEIVRSTAATNDVALQEISWAEAAGDVVGENVVVRLTAKVRDQAPPEGCPADTWLSSDTEVQLVD
jgi:hypothetical protein